MYFHLCRSFERFALKAFFGHRLHVGEIFAYATFNAHSKMKEINQQDIMVMEVVVEKNGERASVCLFKTMNLQGVVETGN